MTTPKSAEELRTAAREVVEQARRATDPEERRRLSDLAFQLAQEAEALERRQNENG